MRNQWLQVGKVSLLVFAFFALLGLIPYLHYAVDQGWPGGFFPYLWATLAGWVASLDWYLPVAALAGGVALMSSRHVDRPRLIHVFLVCAAFAALSFALRGFIGPHLEHHARLGLLDMANQRQAELAASLRPNDWSYLRELAVRDGNRADSAALLAMVDSTIAFAVLSAIMFPLGLAIGNGGRRFLAPTRRRATWAMAAGTTAVVYGAQIGAWRVAMTAEIWPAALVYFGFLTIPLVILLTLVWSGSALPLPERPQGTPSSEGVT